MANKNQCYLCGGKLNDGYCPACGLDNTRIHRKHYHLNESYSVASTNGDARRAPAKCEKRKQNERKSSMPSLGKEQNKRASISQERKNTSRLMQSAAVVGVVMGVVGVVTSLVVSYSKPHISFREEPAADYESINPYEMVERELPETGDYYEMELEQGEYLVGVHLPEGRYVAELLEGRGSFGVDDYENGIYFWQPVGMEEEYGETEILDDIRLFRGAHVTVDSGLLLRIVTENGQTGQLETVENPLTDSITMKKNQTLLVGEDISEGVYDLSVVSGWTDLNCKIPDEDFVEGYYERAYWLSGEERDDIYRNLYLEEGIEITAEDGPLLLTPSKVIGSGDYKGYYKYY